MNEINIKLTIDGQEAVQTLRLTQNEYNKLYTTFAGFQGFPPQAFASMKALRSELLGLTQVSEETTQATSEFIKYYALSEKQIQQVIASLREEQKNLSINSSEYQAHIAAISNLSNAYELLISRREEPQPAVVTPQSNVIIQQENILLTQLKQELLEVGETSELAASSVADYIKYTGLLENEVEQLITRLKEEKSALAIGSSEYNAHSRAITNLENGFRGIQEPQNQFMRGSTNMNMALSQFGYALNDSSVFLLSFRTGLMGIANNVPMIIQYFAAAKKEAEGLGQSVGQTLVASLKGPGGLLVAVNAVMLAMQLLPAVFSDTTKEVKKQTDEIKKLRDEYSRLTSAEISNYLTELDKQMAEFDKKHSGTIRTPVGSTGRTGAGRIQMIDKKVEGEERYGSDWDSVQSIQNKKKALQEADKDMGVLKELNNRVREHQEQLDGLSKRKDAKYYWKKIVPEAETFEEASKAVTKWRDDARKAVEEMDGTGKGKKGDKAKTYEERLSGMMDYYDELTKRDKDYNVLYEGYLNEQHQYYMDLIAKKKYGIQDLSAEELKALNTIEEKLKESRFTPIGDVAGIQAKGLDVRGFSTLPRDGAKLLTEKDLQDRKDALAKEKEINKMKAELYGKDYDEQKQQIDDWYDAAKDKYDLDLANHKTTTAEKEIIDQLYHKKLTDLEEKSLKKKLEGYQKAVDAASSLFNNLFSLASESAKDEIGEWKDKEDKKLDEEHKAALKHAKTQSDKEKIDAQFQAKKDKLDDEANEKAKEKLLLLFRLKQAADIAQATMSTYTAATKAMEEVPFPFNFAAAALVVAGGLANVALIANQKIPGFAKGSMGLVGENGPEIIAPLNEYASGQAELIARTVNAVQNSMQDIAVYQNSQMDPAFADEIRRLNSNFEKYATSPIPTYNIYGSRFAQETTRRGLAGMKREKLL